LYFFCVKLKTNSKIEKRKRKERTKKKKERKKKENQNQFSSLLQWKLYCCEHCGSSVSEGSTRSLGLDFWADKGLLVGLSGKDVPERFRCDRFSIEDRGERDFGEFPFVPG